MFTRVLFLLLCIFLGAEQTRATPFCTFVPLAESLRLLQQPKASVSEIAARYGVTVGIFSQCILAQFQSVTQPNSLLDFATAFDTTPGVLDAAGEPAEVGAKVLDKARADVQHQPALLLYVRILERFLPYFNDIEQMGYAEFFMRITALRDMSVEQRKEHFVKAIDFYTNRRVTLENLVSLAVLSLASSSTQEERTGFIRWLHNKARMETINTEDLTGKVLPSAVMVQHWSVVDMILFVLRARQVEIPAVLSACRIGTNSLVEYAILQESPDVLEALLLRGMPLDGVRNLLDTALLNKIRTKIESFQVGQESGYCVETKWRSIQGYYGCEGYHACEHPGKQTEDVKISLRSYNSCDITHKRNVYCLYGKLCRYARHYSDLVTDRPQPTCPYAKTRSPVVGVNDLPTYRALVTEKPEIAALFAWYDKFVRTLDVCAQISRSDCRVIEINQEAGPSDPDTYFKTKSSAPQSVEKKKPKNKTCVLL